MWRRVALVRTDISDRINELGTAFGVTSNCSLILSTLMMETIRHSVTPVLTRATRRHIPEDGVLCSHSLENLKPYNFSFITQNNNNGFCWNAFRLTDYLSDRCLWLYWRGWDSEIGSTYSVIVTPETETSCHRTETPHHKKLQVATLFP
jgi:hypothetical protein